MTTTVASFTVRFVCLGSVRLDIKVLRKISSFIVQERRMRTHAEDTNLLNTLVMQYSSPIMQSHAANQTYMRLIRHLEVHEQYIMNDHLRPAARRLQLCTMWAYTAHGYVVRHLNLGDETLHQLDFFESLHVKISERVGCTGHERNMID